MQLGRIQLEKVRRFDTGHGLAARRSPTELFEVEMQEGAELPVALMSLLNRCPFSRLWASVLATSRLSVVAGTGVLAQPAGQEFNTSQSELIFITQLQGRLMAMAELKLSASPFSRIDVVLANGSIEHERAREGSLLIVGSPDINVAAAAMTSWIGDDTQSVDYASPARGGRIKLLMASDATLMKQHGHYELPIDHGVLTVAANPIATHQSRKAFIFCVMGIDAECQAAAAACLLNDNDIAAILDPLNLVLQGQAAAIQIHVPRANSARIGSPFAITDAPTIAVEA